MCRKLQGKSTPSAKLARRREVASEQRGEPTADGESEARSLVALPDLRELLEDAIDVLRRNSNPGVGDGDLDSWSQIPRLPTSSLAAAANPAYSRARLTAERIGKGRASLGGCGNGS